MVCGAVIRLLVGRRPVSDGDVNISELDAQDPAARRAWFEVMDTSARANRPHALLEGFTAFEVSVTEAGEHARRVRLEARDDEGLVGVADRKSVV